MSPPADPRSGSTGPPDQQTLRLLEKRLARDSLVTDTAFEPDTHEPRLLRAQIDINRYPDSIGAVRLDIRWFTTGEFSIHYVETSTDGNRWECRWDRHPNEHNARLHFHQPPAGIDIEALTLPSAHPLDVYSTVLTAIDGRIDTLWASDR